MSLRDVVLQAKKATRALEPNLQIARCITVAVDYPDTATSYSRPGYTWVKEHGQEKAFEVFNPTGRNSLDMPVLVYSLPKAPFMKAIYGIDWETLSGNLLSDIGEGSGLAGNPYGNHGVSHEWPDGFQGVDAFRVYTRALASLQASVLEDLKVTILPGVYTLNDTPYYYPGAIYDFSSDMPSANMSVRAVLYFDPYALSLGTVSGTEVPLTGYPEFPSAPKYTFPIVWAWLKDGDVSLDDTRLTDPRALYAIKGTHHEDHENGGDDELSVTNLSGKLADLQDAGWIQGVEVSDIDPTNLQVLAYDQATGKYTPHDKVEGFTDLEDVPANYAGDGGKVVKVRVDELGLEFVAGGAGVSDFTDLGDAPASYVGYGGSYVKVSAGEAGLEFDDPSLSGAAKVYINSNFR